MPAVGPGLHTELTEQIIGAAQRVYRALGTGFIEKVYENALVIELEAAGLQVCQQVPIDVFYRGKIVGQFEADLLVEAKVMLELKAVEHVLEVHEVQLVNYLRATRIELGLIINFGPKLVVRRRILTNDRKVS